jgi:hypothetical protein
LAKKVSLERPTYRSELSCHRNCGENCAMRRRTSWAHWIGAPVVICAVLGCGDSGRVPVYPVQGKVTFNNRPLVGGGSIAFVPLGNQAGKTAGGEITADGKYELTTYGPGDGSMTGEFRVVITQVTEREPERTPDGKKAAQPTQVVGQADRIPAIYSDFQKSPLRAKVEAKSANEIDFVLTPK